MFISMIGIQQRSQLYTTKGRCLRVIGRNSIVRRRQLVPRLQAAAASPDPYQVLGVSNKTSSDNIQRAYRTKLKEAKISGDEELVNIIEQAHSSIMMKELAMRMEGGTSKDVAYADKAIYLPWRPRWCMADRKLTLIAAGLQIGLLLYSLAMTGSTGTQPVIGSAMACAAIVYFKVEKLFPSGGGVAFSADESDRKQGGKNLFRCVFVAVMGTAAGIVLFFTLPDLISNVFLRKPLPEWVYDSQDTVLNTGVIVMNLFLSVFFR